MILKTLLRNIFSLALILIQINWATAQAVLENYIDEGLKNSLTLKQEGFLLEKAMFSLDEAKRMQRPNINFSTTYTFGAGGRTIDFPVGDLLNNAYATLNQLTNTQQFPQLKNQKVVLNPYNFYDAKFRTIYPLINAEIHINQKVKAQFINQKQAEINVYKRELVKEIKMAYFKYAQSSQAIHLYENGLQLLAELKRVNQSLVNNGVANGMVLLKSNAEISKIEAQLTEARNNQQNAKAYFNFLINKNFDAEIVADTLYTSHSSNFSKEIKADIKNREELEKLQSAIALAGLGLNFQKAFFRPKLGAFLDMGSQGFIDNRGQSLYALGGISFEYPIYNGKKTLSRIQQAEMDLNAINTQNESVQNQLELQLKVAVNSYFSVLTVYEKSKDQILLNQRYYNDLLKKYKEGQVLLIELLDAQTQVLNSELQRSIQLSNVWIKLADIERISAAYPLR
ncbi:MAG: TolC family protein [Saprospiraceae bacterium]